VGAVSHFTLDLRAAFGVMVSASHNPAADNGIKFFGSDGAKLDDEAEASLESRFRHLPPVAPLSGADLGIQVALGDGVDKYVDAITGVSEFGLSGLEVALDCANGAAFMAAPALFKRLGADVKAVATEPSGMNINEGCGATRPDYLAGVADGRIGLSFDGDADRLIAVDENGEGVNGDAIMAILARHLRGRDQLPDDKIVATVMSNLGFKMAMQKLGVTVLETQVGDRYVLEEMRRSGAGLGGEQSGHVIFGRRPTGDGLLTGMRLLEVVAATGAPLKELRRIMQDLPQVLRNVTVRVKERLPDAAEVWAAVDKAEKRLGDDGRVLVRASGTEPLVRVMVEARSAPEAAGLADDIAIVVRRELGSTG